MSGYEWVSSGTLAALYAERQERKKEISTLERWIVEASVYMGRHCGKSADRLVLDAEKLGLWDCGELGENEMDTVERILKKKGLDSE